MLMWIFPHRQRCALFRCFIVFFACGKYIHLYAMQMKRGHVCAGMSNGPLNVEGEHEFASLQQFQEAIKGFYWFLVVLKATHIGLTQDIGMLWPQTTGLWRISAIFKVEKTSFGDVCGDCCFLAKRVSAHGDMQWTLFRKMTEQRRCTFILASLRIGFPTFTSRMRSIRRSPPVCKGLCSLSVPLLSALLTL